MKRKFKVGDVVVANKIRKKDIREEEYLRGWINENPLRVAKVTEIDAARVKRLNDFSIRIISFTGAELYCAARELTLVGEDEKT